MTVRIFFIVICYYIYYARKVTAFFSIVQTKSHRLKCGASVLLLDGAIHLRWSINPQPSSVALFA